MAWRVRELLATVPLGAMDQRARLAVLFGSRVGRAMAAGAPATQEPYTDLRDTTKLDGAAAPTGPAVSPYRP